MMFGLFDYLKLGIGGVVGASLVFGWAVLWHGPSEYRLGQDTEQKAARERAMELIERRMKDDAEISVFDAADLCRELGGVWVREHERCD